MNIEGMSGAVLEEMYGYDEYMGFSLKKLARKTVHVAKKAGGVVARNVGNVAVAATVVPTGGLSLLAKKNVRKSAAKVGGVVARNAGNAAVYATVVPTFGLSLLAKKSGRNVAASSARFVQKKIVRPVSHQVANVARSPIASSLISSAANFIPGGNSALTAARTASNMFAKKAHAALTPDAAEPVAKAGISMPLVLLIGSAGLAALFMATKKK